jgi:hypothetical protein
LLRKLEGPISKILIMGLPGAGKTTLARALAPMLSAVWFNADEVRANINKDLGFSPEDRIEQARRMGWLCDKVVESGAIAIADFVCPTPETRAAFGPAYVVWVDRIKEGRFADTNRLFMAPEHYDIRVSGDDPASSWARLITERFNAERLARGRLKRATFKVGSSASSLSVVGLALANYARAGELYESLGADAALEWIAALGAAL